MWKLIGILSIITVITLGWCFHYSHKTIEAQQVPFTTYSYTPEAMLAILNRIRAENGSKPLKLDPRLNQSAQMKADQLARDGWSETPHIEANGKHGYQYATELVPECKLPSENLLANTAEIKNGFKWWLNSPAHKKAMLSDQWEITGFAINKGYVVNHFCDII